MLTYMKKKSKSVKTFKPIKKVAKDKGIDRREVYKELKVK